MAEADPARQLRLLQALCGALAGSVVAYGVVLSVAEAEVALPEAFRPVLDVLVLLGLSLLPVSYAIKSAVARRLQQIEAPSEKLIANAYFFATLLAFAVREGAALVAFLVAFVAGSHTWYFIVAGLTLVTMASDWPTAQRYSHWGGRPS